MPIYEYQCNNCQSDFDLLVNPSTEIACKSCGSNDVKKKLTLFGFSQAGNDPAPPPCAGSCGGGFNQGVCGSGMCGG